jgi:Arc/MetJ-type ribon-helix-helix transcriptional regulator
VSAAEIANRRFQISKVVHGTNASLSPDAHRLIEDRMKRGDFATGDALVQEGLASLSQREAEGEFDPGEWDQLLDEGGNSGPPLHGERVLAELRELRNRKQSKAG